MAKNDKLSRLLSFVVFILLMSAAAIINNGKIAGYGMKVEQQNKQINDTIMQNSDGSVVVNTVALGKGVLGYGGPVPLRIYINKVGIIEKIEALDNSETPAFFDHAKTLLDRWNGRTVDEALAMDVDAVSGATFSSEAIKQNVELGLKYAKYNVVSKHEAKEWTLVSVVALLVVLLGMILPIFVKNRTMHMVQLVLNVAVLGLWSGTFLSYAALMNLFTNGISLTSFSAMASTLLMLVVAFVYPVFGRVGHYCANICPLGSAQEILGKITRKKINVPKRVLVVLGMFRNLLWAVLMLLMLSGISIDWMDFELFTAFLYSSAPVYMLVIAIAFLLLSVFVPRPYCRFVCPTGMLMK